MDRTARQKLCIKRWVNSGCCSTIVASTGFGKTRCALEAILLLLKHQPDAIIKIVVPTEVLRKQWLDDYVNKYGIATNCIVEIINTTIMYESTCDLLVIDEIHVTGAAQISKVFKQVHYKMILGLTATIERLDGKEELIKQYAPVCDTITMKEALENGWVAPVKNYLVLLDVDLTEYKELDRKFNAYFSFFSYNFDIAMKCLQDWKARNNYAKQLGVTPKEVLATSASWMRALSARKKFISSHPKKIEVCKKILAARKDKKCITFSPTIADAKKIGCDYVFHSQQKKKENEEIMRQFNACEKGSIASSKALNTGIDVKGLSVGIIMDVNSSKIKSAQTLGRVIRFEPGKTAEMFVLVIKGTQEVKWFSNSNTSEVTVINEAQLDQILEGKEIQTRPQNHIVDTTYRF